VENKEYIRIFRKFQNRKATKDEIEILLRWLDDKESFNQWADNEWNNSSSIMNNDLQERIYLCIREKISKEQTRKTTQNRRLFMRFVQTVAACIVIAVGSLLLYHYYNFGHYADFRKMAANIDVTNSKQITLTTSNVSVNFKNNIFITYTKEGKVLADSTIIQTNNSNQNREEYNQLCVPAGERAKLKLSDGSLLTVNSLSKIIYPRQFKGKTRRIYAEGEVYFDIVHDANHPFIVTSMDFDLRVLGTQFEISTYQRTQTNIVLVKGSVEVNDRLSGYARLTPNELLVLSNGKIIQQKKVDVGLYTCWINKMFILDGMTLRDVVNKLSIYYNTPIKCNTSLAGRKLYGKLDLKNNLDSVLDCLQQILPVRRTKTNTNE
jgi:transmembrane sensor